MEKKHTVQNKEKQNKKMDEKQKYNKNIGDDRKCVYKKGKRLQREKAAGFDGDDFNDGRGKKAKMKVQQRF